MYIEDAAFRRGRRPGFSSHYCEKSTFDPPLAVIAVNSLNSPFPTQFPSPRSTALQLPTRDELITLAIRLEDVKSGVPNSLRY
jgi:hypothetical protein